MYIKFRGNVAKGVYYTHNGIGKTAFARKKVIIAAGHRSSLLLENSGVGNPEIIEPLLQSVGMKTVADVPGVGENLGNDGYVTITLSRTGSVDKNRNNLYVGGAFWPYPGGNSPDGISERFSQIFGADLIDEDSDTFSIFAGVLNVTSRGYAHIQSPDPLYVPLVGADTLQDYHDQQNWLRMMREQIRPIVQAMTNASSDIQLEDEIPWDVVNHSTDISLMDWIIAHYTHAHHWFGTNSMKPYEDGGVVDSSGHVHRTKNLIVADVSIFPVKLDGNTGVPGYIAGSVIGRKLAREDKMGDTIHDDL